MFESDDTGQLVLCFEDPSSVLLFTIEHDGPSQVTRGDISAHKQHCEKFCHGAAIRVKNMWLGERPVTFSMCQILREERIKESDFSLQHCYKVDICDRKLKRSQK